MARVGEDPSTAVSGSAPDLTTSAPRAPVSPTTTMSTTTQNTSEAERLKAEGNALFIKNDFKRAYAKYTEALKHDDKNATIYCNRAACSLGLNRYDGQGAIDVCPWLTTQRFP